MWNFKKIALTEEVAPFIWIVYGTQTRQTLHKNGVSIWAGRYSHLQNNWGPKTSFQPVFSALNTYIHTYIHSHTYVYIHMCTCFETVENKGNDCQLFCKWRYVTFPVWIVSKHLFLNDFIFFVLKYKIVLNDTIQKRKCNLFKIQTKMISRHTRMHVCVCLVCLYLRQAKISRVCLDCHGMTRKMVLWYWHPQRSGEELLSISYWLSFFLFFPPFWKSKKCSQWLFLHSVVLAYYPNMPGRKKEKKRKKDNQYEIESMINTASFKIIETHFNGFPVVSWYKWLLKPLKRGSIILQLAVVCHVFSNNVLVVIWIRTWSCVLVCIGV